MNPWAAWTFCRYEIQYQKKRQIVVLSVLGGVILLAGCRLVESMGLGHQGRIVRDLSLTLIALFLLAYVLYLAIPLFKREFEDQTAPSFLVRPVSRLDYLLGKEMAFIFLVGTTTFFLFFLLVGFLWLYEKTISWDLFAAAGLTLLDILIIGAMASFLSLLASETVTLALILAIYFVSHLPLAYFSFFSGGTLRWYFALIVKTALPQLQYFNIKDLLLGERGLRWSYLILVFLYGAVYLFSVLGLSWVLVEKKDA